MTGKSVFLIYHYTLWNVGIVNTINCTFADYAQWRIFCTMQNYLHWARWRLFCTVRWRLGEDNLVGVTQPLLTSAIGWPQIMQYHNFKTNTISQQIQFHKNHNTMILQYHDSPEQHYHTTQYHSITIPQHQKITISWYSIITLPQ